jgi:serine/threonine-protein kinase
MPYIIKNEATGFVLDSNADKQVYTGNPNGGAFQHWQLQDAGNGFWVIRDEATGFVLDSNADMQAYTGSPNGGAFQRWQFVGTGF